MKPLLVLVDHLSDWEPFLPSKQVLAIDDYLRDYNVTKGYVINLCRDYSYLGLGYYGSLLAEARGGHVFPSVRAITELNNFESGYLLPLKDGNQLDLLYKRTIPNNGEICFRVYFGQTRTPELASIARRIFETFTFPVLDLCLVRLQANLWAIRELKSLHLEELNDADQEAFADALDVFNRKIWRNKRSAKNYKYDVAMLYNPDEALPPSNKGALKAFQKAGKEIGLNVELITHKSASRIGEFDALFIRETTNVDHHTYRLAQAAENQGLLVIDSPADIMRCSNKVYLHERLQAYQVDTPKTLLFIGNQPFDIEGAIQILGFPMIVKVPDGSFSIGVEKAKNKTELQECIGRLNEHSAILLLQEYMPTEFDWRIGILNNQAIFACRYHMAKNHWQIYNHKANSHRSGNVDAMSVEKAPKQVVKAALKAAKAMGNGFYGVDLKQHGERVVVIEVNDNPNVDAGVEDLHSGHMLYQQIMSIMLRLLDEMNGR